MATTFSTPESELVVFEYSSFDSIMDDLIVAMQYNGKNYEIAHKTGEYNVPNLRFGAKIRKVNKLRAQIQDLLRDNDVETDFVSEIAFKLEYEQGTNYINEIQLSYPGILSTETIAIPNSKNKDPFNDSATVYFLKNAGEISRNYRLGSESTTNYVSFIGSYVYSAPESTKKPFTNNNALSVFGDIETSCANNYIGRFSETVPGTQVTGELVRFTDALEEKYSQTFFDIDSEKQFNQIIKNPKFNERRIQDALNTFDNKKAQFLEEILGDLRDSKNLKDLYDKTLDSIDVKAIRKVLKQQAIQKFNSVDPEAAIKQVAFSVIKNLDPKDLANLYSRSVLNLSLPNSPISFDVSAKFQELWDEINEDTNVALPELDSFDVSSSFTALNANLADVKPIQKPKIGMPKLTSDQIPQIREVFLELIRRDSFSFDELLKEVSLFSSTKFDTDFIDDVVGVTKSITPDSINNLQKINNPITLPYIPPLTPAFPGFGDLTKLAINLVEKAALKAAISTLKASATGILTQALKSAKSNLQDAVQQKLDNVTGSSPDAMLNIVKNQICSDRATPEEVAETVKTVWQNFSLLQNGAIAAPTEGDVKQFMEDISTSLSQQQIINLFSGTPDQDSLNKVTNILNRSGNESLRLSLPSEAAVENAFSGLGTLIDRNRLQVLNDLEALAGEERFEDLCDAPSLVIARDEELRETLAAKGLSEAEIDEQIELATNEVLKELNDFVKNLISPNSLISLSEVGEEEAKGYSSEQDPALSEANADLFEATFQSLETLFVQDLSLGNLSKRRQKGFLDIVLSAVDTKPGKAFSKTSPKIKKEQAEKFVSNLKEDYFDIDVDYISAGKNEVTFTYNEDNKITYTYGGDLQISKLTNTEEITKIPVTYDVSSEAKNYISSITSLSLPRLIFSRWTGTSYTNAFSRNATTDSQNTQISKFLQKSDAFIQSDAYPSLINGIIENFIKQISSIQDSWEYGNGTTKVTVKDGDESDGVGSWYPVLQESYSGWRRIYKSSIPVSGDRDPLFNFQSSEEVSKEFYEAVPQDTRASLPPELFKRVKEQPFSNINTKTNNAMLAGLIDATIKLFMFDSFIKGTPSFKMYRLSKQNYGEPLSAYIAEMILQAVLQEARRTPFYRWKTLGKNGFYYIFLEQLVQTYSERVDAGIITPSLRAQDSLSALSDKLETRDPDDDSVSDFKDFIDESLDLIRPLIQELVEQTWDQVAEETDKIYSPRYSNITDNILRDWILNSEIVNVPQTITDTDYIATPSVSGFSIEGLQAELDAAREARDLAQDDIDAQSVIRSDETKKERERRNALLQEAIGKKEKAETQIADLEDKIKTLESLTTPNQLPFLLQRYVKLSNPEDYRIISPEEYDTFPNKSEYPEISAGIRLLYVPGDSYDSKLTEVWRSDTLGTGIKKVFSDTFERERSYIATETTGPRYIIPMFAAERISSEEEITGDFPDNILVEDLKNTPAYEAMFKVSLPITNLLSTTTIYIIDNFVNSVVLKRESKRDAGKWNGDTFQLSKKYLKDMMEQSYYARSGNFAKEVLNDIGNTVNNFTSGIENALEGDFDPEDFDGVGELIDTSEIDNLPSWRKLREIATPEGISEVIESKRTKNR